MVQVRMLLVFIDSLKVKMGGKPEDMRKSAPGRPGFLQPRIVGTDGCRAPWKALVLELRAWLLRALCCPAWLSAGEALVAYAVSFLSSLVTFPKAEHSDNGSHSFLLKTQARYMTGCWLDLHSNLPPHSGKKIIPYRIVF